MRYAKGHGTGNDFIVVPDLDGRLDLGAEGVRRLCDRRTGIGGDGVLRVGGRAAGPGLAIATGAGVRTVRQEADGALTVDMGQVTVGRAGWAVIGGRRYAGVAVTVGNPHLVCLVSEPLAGIDLTEPPEFDAGVFPGGVNIEVVRAAVDHAIEMRVHERGSGETLSCGTGAVAAAAGAAAAAGEWPASGRRLWTVGVPGGRLAVAPGAAASLLTGPAVIVAEGETCASWLDDPLVTAPSTA